MEQLSREERIRQDDQCNRAWQLFVKDMHFEALSGVVGYLFQGLDSATISQQLRDLRARLYTVSLPDSILKAGTEVRKSLFADLAQKESLRLLKMIQGECKKSEGMMRDIMRRQR